VSAVALEIVSIIRVSPFAMMYIPETAADVKFVPTPTTLVVPLIVIEPVVDAVSPCSTTPTPATVKSTLVIDGKLVEGTVVIQTSAAPPVEPPKPPTQPSSCVHGMYLGDRVWDLHPVQLWPVPPLAASGDLGTALQFVADQAQFPDGFRIQFVDETQPQHFKDYIVSTCPHDFTPLTVAAQALQCGPTGGPIYFVFRPPKWGYEVQLTPGATYYLNFRDHDEPRGTVLSQFVCYAAS